MQIIVSLKQEQEEQQWVPCLLLLTGRRQLWCSKHLPSFSSFPLISTQSSLPLSLLITSPFFQRISFAPSPPPLLFPQPNVSCFLCSPFSPDVPFICPITFTFSSLLFNSSLAAFSSWEFHVLFFLQSLSSPPLCCTPRPDKTRSRQGNYDLAYFPLFQGKMCLKTYFIFHKCSLGTIFPYIFLQPFEMKMRNIFLGSWKGKKWQGYRTILPHMIHEYCLASQARLLYLWNEYGK